MQDDVPALQVCMASGEWVYAPCIPGALLVNLGDMAQRWTNDRYRSTLHRVSNVTSATRHSVVFFCNADFDAEIAPAELLLQTTGGRMQGQPAECPHYEPVQAGPHLMRRLGLESVSRLPSLVASSA
jgi:isopenicillin N synthase-like dioxygenase